MITVELGILWSISRRYCSNLKHTTSESSKHSKSCVSVSSTGHCTLSARLGLHAGHLFQQLRSVLDQSAAFWSDHNYFDPQTPFFSYLYDLVCYRLSLDACCSSLAVLKPQTLLCVFELPCALLTLCQNDADQPQTSVWNSRDMHTQGVTSPTCSYPSSPAFLSPPFRCIIKGLFRRAAFCISKQQNRTP